MPLQSFRVLHISDLHLAARPNLSGWHSGVGWKILLSQLWDQARHRRLPITLMTGSHDELVGNAMLTALESELAQHPDMKVLITGDVATIGTFNDLKAARDWLDGANGAAVPLPESRLFTMPGNHDRFRGIPTLHSGSTHFEDKQIFGQRWDRSLAAAPRQEPVREFQMETQPGVPGLSIICADFALRTARSVKRPVFHFDHGHVDAETLGALCRSTKFAQEHGQAVVWGIHYPPNFPGEWIKKLRGYRTLLEKASEYGVNHIFSGHTHQQITYRTDVGGSPVFVHCAGTAMCYSAPCHAFYGHTILTLNGKVNDVQSVEYTFRQQMPPVANITWTQQARTSADHRSVRLPWLRRLGW